MKPVRRRSTTRPLIIPLLGVVVAALAPVPASAAPAADAPGSGLGRHDRQLLAEARANGDPTVTMLIAAKPGSSDAVARGLQGLGGRIGYHDQALGYLRAEVPTARAEKAAAVSGVQAADLDEVVPLDDPRPDGATVPTPFPPPDSSTPRDNPYMPVGRPGPPRSPPPTPPGTAAA
ncbi:hypothetical protein ACFQV2_20325 [Actinokineospora soli]|uniref:Peptidase inhibitor I9 n=1 Tax=Actinokineospora soli TaxID=1048753 RepID=A0ABW2TRU5_9PSEU